MVRNFQFDAHRLEPVFFYEEGVDIVAWIERIKCLSVQSNLLLRISDDTLIVKLYQEVQFKWITRQLNQPSGIKVFIDTYRN